MSQHGRHLTGAPHRHIDVVCVYKNTHIVEIRPVFLGRLDNRPLGACV